MDSSQTRRKILQTGGIALVGALSGCSGVISEGKNATALNVAMKNDLPDHHRMKLEFSPNGADDAFEKTVGLDSGEKKAFKNVTPYPAEKSTATVVTQLDDEPEKRASEVPFSKKLEEFRVVARNVDGTPTLMWMSRNRSDDGFF